MTDPYVVLGVSSTASDEEVKTAYRNLARKYHPDNYAEAPDLADLASEKMKEVNEAYDTIVTDRKNGGSRTGASSSGGSYGSSSNYGSNNSYGSSAGYSYSGANAGGAYSNTYSTTTSFPDIRKLIMSNRFADAEQLLDSVSQERRNAEWNFLKGTVLYRRGWLEQAYTYLQTAVKLDPNNSEFRAAYNQAQQMRSGKMGGYRAGSGSDKGGCDVCSMCCGMLCADSCCECFGGDIISCC